MKSRRIALSKMPGPGDVDAIDPTAPVGHARGIHVSNEGPTLNGTYFTSNQPPTETRPFHSRSRKTGSYRSAAD